MHSLQLALINFDKNIDISDTNEVSKHVSIALENDTGREMWCDWFAVGGRWEDYLQKTLEPMVWPNKLDSPIALRLTKDNWKLAIKLLEEVIELRSENLMYHVNELKKSDIDIKDIILDPNIPVPKWTVPYSISSIFALKCGDWNHESGYVDTINWMNASPERLLDYLKGNGNDHWDGKIEECALVVIDFHH